MAICVLIGSASLSSCASIASGFCFWNVEKQYKEVGTRLVANFPKNSTTSPEYTCNEDAGPSLVFHTTASFRVLSSTIQRAGFDRVEKPYPAFGYDRHMFYFVSPKSAKKRWKIPVGRWDEAPAGTAHWWSVGVTDMGSGG